MVNIGGSCAADGYLREGEVLYTRNTINTVFYLVDLKILCGIIDIRVGPNKNGFSLLPLNFAKHIRYIYAIVMPRPPPRARGGRAGRAAARARENTEKRNSIRAVS